MLGYDKPSYELPENCKFISMGEQGDVSEWSTDLRRYFLNCENDYFLYGTEDVFFYDTPNIEYINHLLERMKDDGSVGRLQLTDGAEENTCTLETSWHYKVDLIEEVTGCPWGDFKLFKQRRESNYTLNTQLSLWNKEYFLKYMIDGMTPWQFELEGSKLARSDEDYEVWMVDGAIPIKKKEGFNGDGWDNVDYWVHALDDELKRRILE